MAATSDVKTTATDAEADDVEVSVSVVDLVKDGAPAGRVPVKISYGIIERFSEGLYSSPNKTFEELITNSYDAGAEKVWVYLPQDLTATDATLVVVDDGQSMDLGGLQDLWKIGESRKRTEAPPPGRARPVGKFGIGKLATYVLAERLTYVAHRDGQYLAVTMDYSRVSPKAELLDAVALSLDVVSLTKEQAFEAVKQALACTPHGDEAHVLSDLDGLDHWTAAILSDLKETARDIKIGRLRWVLRTALPLNPSFELEMNDAEVTSSKVDGEVMWTYVSGENESMLARNAEKPWGPGEPCSVKQSVVGLDPETGVKTVQTVEIPAVRLPHAGVVSGVAQLFKQPLQRGRSEDLGRSHGFFVRVRGRLINLDDEDFSVGPELRHGTLTRFRMEVNADDLDEQVASARESLKESPQLDELKNYLLAVFNRARAVSTDADGGDLISGLSKNGRLAQPSTALSQGPLRRMLQRAVSGERAIAETLGFDEGDVVGVQDVLDAGGDVVESVLLESRESSAAMATYDPARRAVVLNQEHPFVSNYIGGKTVAEPLKLIGLSEILTKAYLLDENISPEVIERVMKRRDSFLRELTMRFPRSAPVIASRLRDSANDENALEDAVGDALELLGFHVLRLGGAQHGTDGVGTARLGIRDSGRASYAFTYDAKSTSSAARSALLDATETAPAPGRIRADTARTSVLRVHRERAAGKHDLEVSPAFTLLVAPDFQGATTDDGLINDVCQNDGITAIRVDDLARLVELFTLQGLNPADLRPLFDARTPEETRAWVDRQAEKVRVPRPPVSVLVEVLVEHSERKTPIVLDSLAAHLVHKGHDLSTAEIDGLVRGLGALAPKSVYVDGKFIALNASPASLYAEIRQSLDVFDAELVSDYLETVPRGAAQ